MNTNELDINQTDNKHIVTRTNQFESAYIKEY